MKKHGGVRRGAGRPRKDSPLGYLRVLEDPKAGPEEKSEAAVGLSHFQWKETTRRGFLRFTGADYIELRRKVVEELWNALLIGLPKMAERGDASQAWFAYRMITARRYGVLRPPSAVLEKVRELAPQGARALWRISIAEDPKDPLYKSTAFLKIRRQARSALCKSIGIPVSKELVQVSGKGFVRLFLETFAKARPVLSPAQAVVLAAWADREKGTKFLQSGLKAGIFRLRE